MNSTVTANLKEYLNSCLRFKSYREYAPKDQISSVVAEWLSRKEYKDYYVYLAWFAIRELLLKKCESNVTNGDIIKTMMEYPTEFAKYIGEGINMNRIDTSDMMWAYQWLEDRKNECRDDRKVYIFKIKSVANKFRKDLRAYDDIVHTLVCNIPDCISGELQSDDIHTVPRESADECMKRILGFLRDSLINDKWMYIENPYCYSMVNWIMEYCHTERYDERLVQCIYAAILFILRYGYDDQTNDYRHRTEFWADNGKLYKMACCNASDGYGRIHTGLYRDIYSIVDFITRKTNNYGGHIYTSDLTIQMPEIIMYADPVKRIILPNVYDVTNNKYADINKLASLINPKNIVVVDHAAANNKHYSTIDTIDNCMFVLRGIAMDIIKDEQREQKNYTKEDVDKFITTINSLIDRMSK